MLPITEEIARELLKAHINCVSQDLTGIPEELLQFIQLNFSNLASEFNWVLKFQK